eukprot:gnl/TRDRNA2_/TRDRNA2_201007_c0_seq1.p1 gnl/TRDRNA2_/TRDRNA2_201007_c0~~gnl/TRDRNA2_/TRDRNA2_201007_c0_seq1.p1  ORF type:complete len:253 (-),score=42.11 gnl/TRDRNA2_/TRDRNA2_201007_c0_seq1:45-773(-)
MQAAAEAAEGQGSTRKVNFIEWILHEHTLLSLCFAKDGNLVNVPCCLCCTTCCCLELAPSFTIRQRIFVFLFVLIANTAVLTTVSLGVHSIAWQFAVTTFLLVPFVCWLKQIVPRVSYKLNPIHPLLATAVGFVVLAGFTLYAGYRLSAERTFAEVWEVATRCLLSFGTQLLLEFIVLTWCFFFCKCCCRCCVPVKEDVRSWRDIHLLGTDATLASMSHDAGVARPVTDQVWTVAPAGGQPR